VLVSVIIMLLSRSIKVNWERKNKHPMSYVLPVILTVILLYCSLNLAVPQLLDGVDVIEKNCVMEEIQVDDSVNIGRSTIETKERILFYGPWQFDFQVGQGYRITYTPRSRMIIEVNEIGSSETS
jgi:hypothetical protein